MKYCVRNFRTFTVHSSNCRFYHVLVYFRMSSAALVTIALRIDIFPENRAWHSCKAPVA